MQIFITISCLNFLVRRRSKIYFYLPFLFTCFYRNVRALNLKNMKKFIAATVGAIVDVTFFGLEILLKIFGTALYLMIIAAFIVGLYHFICWLV